MMRISKHVNVEITFKGHSRSLTSRSLLLSSRKLIGFEPNRSDATMKWRETWQSASVVYRALVVDPASDNLGFDLPTYSFVWTGSMCSYSAQVEAVVSKQCQCRQLHGIESCPLMNFADDNTVRLHAHAKVIM